MKREQNIETLRGIAIILMVLGHVVGSDSSKGLKLPDESIYKFLFSGLEYVRMPLFTVISGYVYALKPISLNYSLKKFLSRKIQRLIIPYFIAATLFFLLQYFTPGTNSTVQLSNITNIYYNSFAHFWFAQGIFFVFIFVGILDYNNWLGVINTWLVALILVIFVYLFIDFGSSLLSSNKWPFLLLFFLWGIGLERFNLKKNLFTARVKWVVLFTFCVLIIVQNSSFYFIKKFDLMINLDSFFTISIGLSSTLILINLKYVNRYLARLGNYSYEIYLYHIFGTAASRIILTKLGLKNIGLNIIAGLSCGLTIPILVKKIISKNALLDGLIFGEHKK